MSKSCPECGGAVEYTARTIEIQEGSCSACGRALLLALPPDTNARGASGAALAGAAPAAPCWSCGAPLTLEVLPGRAIDARCTSCEAIVHLAERPDRGPARPTEAEEGESDTDEEEDEAGTGEEEDRGPRPGGPRRSFRPRAGPPGGRGYPDRGRPQGRFDRPPARPCRQCGGPIEIQVNDDGTTTGRCGSCGNTFTMRPRAEGRPGFDRRPGWGGRPGPSRYSERPRGPWQGGRGRRSDDEGPPRRRRRRDDDV